MHFGKEVKSSQFYFLSLRNGPNSPYSCRASHFRKWSLNIGWLCGQLTLKNGKSAVSVSVKMSYFCISKGKMSVYLSHVEKRETTTSSGDADLFSAMLREYFFRMVAAVRNQNTTSRNKSSRIMYRIAAGTVCMIPKWSRQVYSDRHTSRCWYFPLLV